ncbi:hypothetical protein P7E02_17865 [Enterococcus hulanensis]|uniref:hypothetical protein n=1 Tax=Enterococcus hulanensis TaxID=2559929 RepID=UPI00288D5D7E|nr:hypothetical protein [Enterococcus hulanensis]MDT2661749.1 hypothetical protein [Enterococcus hulanensis]
MKKVLSMLGVSLMLLPLGFSAAVASATEMEEVQIEETEVVAEDDIQIEDVVESDAVDEDMVIDESADELSGIEPSLIMTRGTKIPTKKHNIAKGKYTVKGYAYNKVLYTEKLLHGVKKYKISITNAGPKTVKVQFKTTKKTAKTMNIGSKKTVKATVSVGSASTNYYLRFSGGHYDVRGTVSK